MQCDVIKPNVDLLNRNELQELIATYYTNWHDLTQLLVFTISLSKQNWYIKQILNAL